MIEKENQNIVGYPPEKIKNLIEIRGIGIINVKDIFGYSSTLDKSRLNLIVDLIEFDKENKYDRLGYDANK